MGTLYTTSGHVYVNGTILETNSAKSSKDENAHILTTHKFHFLVYTLKKLLHLCNKETKQCPQQDKKKNYYPNCPSAGEWKNYGKVINGILHRYIHQHT